MSPYATPTHNVPVGLTDIFSNNDFTVLDGIEEECSEEPPDDANGLGFDEMQGKEIIDDSFKPLGAYPIQDNS